MHTATLFVDGGVASGRGWWVNHTDDCGFSDDDYDGCKEPDQKTEVQAAVRAIYDAVSWPYPEGVWPVGTFTAGELRTHLEQFLSARA